MSLRIHLFHHTASLFTAGQSAVSLTVSWAKGTGIILITQDEWEKQPTHEAKVALIQTRLDSLWQRVSKKPEPRESKWGSDWVDDGV